jgi:hypothetical protein
LGAYAVDASSDFRNAERLGAVARVTEIRNSNIEIQNNDQMFEEENSKRLLFCSFDHLKFEFVESPAAPSPGVTASFGFSL